ncbi:MAG: enoyl-CoA hydratase [Rhodobacteraceae bacterium]|nr:enoyl-CoA hydratase [Paracoccaceae bacterium]MYI92106.1 enoyl-CoA hydratase [Paracoccaceae bacterium]
MNEEILLRNDKNKIAYLVFNKPEKLNVLSEEMLAALYDQLIKLENDEAIRCIVLTGKGKAFCAGHDLSELTLGRQTPDGGQEYFQKIFDMCSKLMQKIQEVPQPVIAQVNGPAVAAGCQLVATCDLAIAGESAKFGVNGVNIGLFCSTPMVALTRNINLKNAFELLVSGKIIKPEEAQRLGLINRVVSDETLDEEVNELASLISSKLSAAVKIGKKAFYKQAEMPLDEAYDFAGEVMVTNMLYRDTREGINAFLEKRKPDWK